MVDMITRVLEMSTGLFSLSAFIQLSQELRPSR